MQETFARALAPALLILLGAPLPAVAAASGLFLAFATLNHANLPARALGLQRPRAARSEAGEVA